MDMAKLQDFMGKLVTDFGGAALAANVILGEELGLYRAMAGSEPVTPAELAKKTGCNTRLVREWLSAQAAAGYVEHMEGSVRLGDHGAGLPEVAFPRLRQPWRLDRHGHAACQGGRGLRPSALCHRQRQDL